MSQAWGLHEDSPSRSARAGISTCRHTPLTCALAGLLSSGVFLLLFARPKSSTSPWTACVSRLQRASSSGRGRATATLISLKKFSLWTTSRLASYPSQPGGEGEQRREHPLPVPVPGLLASRVALKSLPKGFEMMIKRIAFQLGGFLKLCQASAEARGMCPPCLGMFGFPTVWSA